MTNFPAQLAELEGLHQLATSHAHLTSGPFASTYREQYESLLRNLAPELIKRAKEREWMPIETAPKEDGYEAILLWGGDVIVGFFLDNSKTAVPWKGWRLHSGVPMKRGQPTHWMPLPPAPGAES